MTDDQIKHMANRFLGWKLPENFSPDAGISFTPDANNLTSYKYKHEPIGTNLFNATQAEAMVRYMIEGIEAPVGAFNGEGWVYFNDGSGEEYSHQHPVESGEVIDATNIRRSTEQEDTLWNALQTAHHVLSLPTDTTP